MLNASNYRAESKLLQSRYPYFSGMRLDFDQPADSRRGGSVGDVCPDFGIVLLVPMAPNTYLIYMSTQAEGPRHYSARLAVGHPVSRLHLVVVVVPDCS